MAATRWSPIPGLARTRFLLLCILSTTWMFDNVHSRIHGESKATGVEAEANIDTQKGAESSGTQNQRRLTVSEIFRDLREDEPVKAMIGYRSAQGRDHIKRLAKVADGHDFGEVDAVAVQVPVSVLKELESDPDIRYIEKDDMLYPFQSGLGENLPYGVKMVQGNRIRYKSTRSSGGCNDPSAFKIGVVDSGIYGGHPDLPCSGPDDTRCMGTEFGDTPPWYQDGRGHGTHVSGTIGAIGLNGYGVRGVISDGNFCFVIARVFDDGGNGANWSDILQAVKWVYSQGAKVINMSLGGSSYSNTAEKVYQEMFAKGTIVVAASGNDGTYQKSYPSSYSDVVSVAAIDENKAWASFSQYNEMVDFTAPGKSILSTTALGKGGIAWLELPSSLTKMDMRFMENSPIPKSQQVISGPLVLCGNLGKSECPGKSGQICVIERGEITFEEKSLNCQAGGGVAAIIYNNLEDEYSGKLSDDTQVTIPVASINGVNGQQLVANYLSQTADIQFVDGYAYNDGTSMAAPHVTGAFAAVWRSCSKCNNTDILACFRSTAIDLGPSGRDDKFGYGLIQAKKAYKCLKKKVRCC